MFINEELKSFLLNKFFGLFFMHYLCAQKYQNKNESCLFIIFGFVAEQLF